MKRNMKWLFPVLLTVAAIAVIGFFQLFIRTDEQITYIDWDSAYKINDDGTEEPFSWDTYSNDTELTGTYSFIGTLPEGLPSGSLIFETSGLDIILYLNDEEVSHTYAATTDGSAKMSQSLIPLTEGTSGTVTMVCKIAGSDGVMFPPMLRFLPDNYDTIQSSAIANRASLPAGIAALAFIIVLAIFLLGIMLRKPDWSMIPLLIAVLGLMTFRLIQSQGQYFLPENVNNYVNSPLLGIVTLAALIVYLLMNRRRRFWRSLGLVTAWSVGAFLLCYLISYLTGRSFHEQTNSLIYEMFTTGYYDSIVFWITLWLALSCALISAYYVSRSYADTQSEAQGLLLKNREVTENYRTLAERTAESAAVRHELRHQLTALDVLCQKGEYEELEKALSQIIKKQTADAPAVFTSNYTVNTILQDAASRARRQQTAFHAFVIIPDDLNISELDMCKLLMNMLDNALEAAKKVFPEEKRYISVRVQLSDLYLTISCENSFCGEIHMDKSGIPQTTKADKTAHGFGCRQMREIARKYESIVRFKVTDKNSFLVQTALRIPALDSSGSEL